MSCVAQFSIFPIGRDVSVAEYVARALSIVRESGLDHVFGPMSTSLEGEYDEVMGVIARCHEALRPHCERVYLTVAVDWRQGPAGRIKSKVQSVEERLK